MSPSQHDTAPLPASAGDRPTRRAVSAGPGVRRIRYTPTALVPLLIGVISAVPAAAALGAWGLLLAVPFAVAAVWVLRVGMDVEARRVRVRGMLGSLVVPRADLVGFAVDGRRVQLVRTDGSSVVIPTVRPRDLPMLRELLFGDAPGRSAQPPAGNSMERDTSGEG